MDGFVCSQYTNVCQDGVAQHGPSLYASFVIGGTDALAGCCLCGGGTWSNQSAALQCDEIDNWAKRAHRLLVNGRCLSGQNATSAFTCQDCFAGASAGTGWTRKWTVSLQSPANLMFRQVGSEWKFVEQPCD